MTLSNWNRLKSASVFWMSHEKRFCIQYDRGRVAVEEDEAVYAALAILRNRQELGLLTEHQDKLIKMLSENQFYIENL